MVYYCIIRFLYTKKVFKHLDRYRSENNFIGLSFGLNSCTLLLYLLYSDLFSYYKVKSLNQALIPDHI